MNLLIAILTPECQTRFASELAPRGFNKYYKYLKSQFLSIECLPSTFDIRFFRVSFSIKMTTFQASGGAEP